jgi:putative phosphoesterase
MTVIGVISDTHVPDRVSRLEPRAVEVFRQAGVEAILHAGDVSVPRVLEELGKVAPVHAVRGNRDIFSLAYLPLQIRLNIQGVSIGMAHGHGTLTNYLTDKMRWMFSETKYGRYFKRMLETFPDVDVVVFGHLHAPYRVYLEGKLVLNPGSASFLWPRKYPPSVGLLKISEGKRVEGEIIYLV